ncbi:hypothetical protein LOK49_LG13G01239 [Camellia lanceoleosa]|uniref:Uncharacterized protein n=1 Tax=Camellia lanceoleosa TaxID=1840588 RepID=A0ACC0FL24_9ERIC|nr:hypothetical protein LOK49_LG13G01239 [Camellia lanceoleosa]
MMSRMKWQWERERERRGERRRMWDEGCGTKDVGFGTKDEMAGGRRRKRKRRRKEMRDVGSGTSNEGCEEEQVERMKSEMRDVRKNG